MALVQKTALFQMRLEPDLYAGIQEAAEHHRMSVAALVRQLMFQEVTWNEARKKREAAKAAREAAEAIPAPETFQLEKTPPAPVKAASKGKAKKNRAQRRAEESQARRDAKLEKKTQRVTQ